MQTMPPRPPEALADPQPTPTALTGHLRCWKCGRTVATARGMTGEVNITCRRCRATCIFTAGTVQPGTSGVSCTHVAVST